ncbi:Protein GSNL-1 [Aphelenchoides avenae]|nr:Protein GSNL-1 [Aphelenchus avenae]
MVVTSVDPKLKGIGKRRGLQIWRICKFALEDVPKEQFGNFFTGDSYIVLNTKNIGEWDVHFWLGKNTSQDEAGTAAIKTVELDDSLGGLPVQYREVQDNESSLFLSYFKDGIKYLDGGHQTGFNHVVDPYENYKPKLFHCKGKHNVKCAKESLNLGDVFILDKGLDLYVWMPPQSGRMERMKGVQQAKGIRDNERAGRPKIHVLDEDWKTNDEFWRVFGGKDKVSLVKSAAAGGKDENYWRDNRQQITLWKVSDSSGTLKVTKDAFIVDAAAGGLYVWVGKGCTIAERKKAMDWGQQYLKQQKRPENTQVVRVLETAEPSGFTQWFTNWNTAKKGSTFTPKLFHCSNASGKLVIEELVNFRQEDLQPDDVMVLDGQNLIYVWVGAGANRAEKDAAESTAKKYLETDAVPRHKKASIEVIFQNKETPTFKKYFPSWDEKLFEKQEQNYRNMRTLLF